jgi:hypothetical protein
MSALVLYLETAHSRNAAAPLLRSCDRLDMLERKSMR